MTDKIPATAFIVGAAFLFACGYGALVIMGLGGIAFALESDEPVSPYLQGYAPVALVLSALALLGVMLATGLRRDNRLRLWPIVYSTASALGAYLLGVVVVIVAVSPWAGAISLAHIGQAIAAPASLVVAIAAAVSALAFLGTLRWQARNAQTKQFAHPEQ